MKNKQKTQIFIWTKINSNHYISKSKLLESEGTLINWNKYIKCTTTKKEMVNVIIVTIWAKRSSSNGRKLFASIDVLENSFVETRKVFVTFLQHWLHSVRTHLVEIEMTNPNPKTQKLGIWRFLRFTLSLSVSVRVWNFFNTEALRREWEGK